MFYILVFSGLLIKGEVSVGCQFTIKIKSTTASITDMFFLLIVSLVLPTASPV